jgi:energy-coupling factor transporter ATP-binding protein EcfA2
VVGHTGGGKTTLMHAIARALAPHSNVVFLDPDGVRGKYPGYRVVGAGDDFEAMAKAMVLTGKEVAKRREQRASGQRHFPPVWLLVDEAHDVVSEIEGAWPILEGIIRRGRKLNIHCCIGTQDNQVRTLGLEGKSKLLDNLTRVDVKAASAGRVALVGGQSWNLPHLPCADDTVTTVPQRAAQKTTNTADTALLDRLLADAIQGDTKVNTAEGAVDTDTDTSTANTDTSTADNGTGTTDTDTLSDEQIRQMSAKGISKRRIAQKLKGTQQARLARINAALDSAPAATDNQEDDSDGEPPPAFRGLLG